MNSQSELCRTCYRRGLFSKCNEELNSYNGKYCIKKTFQQKEKKKQICACGRFKVGFIPSNEKKCQMTSKGFCISCDENFCENVELIDCEDFHPQFSEEEIDDHEQTCYGCQREKTSGEDCLQMQWNLDNPTARNLRREHSEEFANHVMKRKLRSGKIITT
jgi:hypothetical protein